ncbi:unnamed protein product [Meganyctiphanes norvegica]|uniref:RING-type domain-containing protein n=1 Tax=Meganyctiphanes norvegica TaxID=48144 RepID=A0AAV2PU95_MEGNR
MGEDTKYCGNCQKDVAENNFTMHSVHCQRNIVVCAMCQESVPKSQYQIHIQDNHKELPCGKCGQNVDASDVFTHEKEKCPKRLVTCPYCDLEVVATEAPAHDEYCGARTDRCKGCTKFVMSKHLQFHYENDHKYLTPEEKEEANNASDEEGPECPICLGPITHPLSLECGHVFCMVCVKGIANNNKNCAICRRDIPRDMLMDIRFCREEDIIKNYVNKPKDKSRVSVSRSHSVPSRRSSDYSIPTARQRLMRTTEDYDRMVSSLISSRTITPTTRYERPSNTHTPAAYTPYSGSTTSTSSTSCADAFKDDDCCCSPSSSSSTPSASTTTATPAYSNRSTTSPDSSCRSSSPTPLSPPPVVPPRAHHVSRFLSAGPTTSSSNTYTRSSTPSRTSTSTSSSDASRTTTVPSEPTSSSGTSSTSRYSTPSSKTVSNSSSPSYSRYSSRTSDDSYTSSTLYSSTSNTATSMTPSAASSTRTSTETSSIRPRRPTTLDLDLNSGNRENSEDIARNPPENATQEEYDRWLAFQLATTSDDVSITEFNKRHEKNESRPAFRRSISMPDRPDDDSSSSDSDSDPNSRSNRRPPTSPRSAASASSYNASRNSSISKSSSDSNASTSSQSSSTGARPKSASLKKRVSFKEDEPPVRRVAPVLLPCEFCDEMFPERDLMRHQTSCDQNETSLPRLSRFSNVRSSSIDALSPLPGTSGSRAGTPTSRSGTPTFRSGTPTSRSGSDSSIPDTPHSTSVSPSRNVTSPTQALSTRSITSPTQTSSRSSSSPTVARSVTSPTPSTETRSITSPTPLSPTEFSKPPRPPAPPMKTEVKPQTPLVPPKNQATVVPRKSPLPPPPNTPPVLPTTIVTVKDATPNSSRPSSTSPALNTSSSGSTISSFASGASSCTTPSTSSSTSPTPVDTPTEDEEDSPFSKPRRGRLLSSAIFSWRNMGGPRSASEARNKYARSNTAPMEETELDHDVPGILTSRSAHQLPVQTDSPVPVDSLKTDTNEQDSNDSFFVKKTNKYRAPAPPQNIDYSQSCPVTPLPHFSPVLPRKEFSDVTEECPSPVNTLISDYSPKAMRKSFNDRLKENFRRMDSKPMMKNEKNIRREEILKKEQEKERSKEEEISCEFCKQIFSPENFRCHKAMCEKVHESDPLQTPTPTPDSNEQTSRSERDSKSPMPIRHNKGPAPQPPTEFERKVNEDNARRRFDRAKSLFNDKSVGSFSEGVTRGRNLERRGSVKEQRSSYWDSKNMDRPYGSRDVLNSNNFESTPSLTSSSTKYGGSVQNLSSYQPSNYSTGHGWSSHVSMVRDDARNRSALNNSSNYNDHGGDNYSTNGSSFDNGEVDYDSSGRCRSRSQSVNRFNNNSNNHSDHSFFHEMRAALCKTSLGHLTNENNGMRYRERSCSRQRPSSMFASSSRFGSNPHLSVYDSLSSPNRSNFSISDAFSNASNNYKRRYNR